jgi:flagellin
MTIGPISSSLTVVPSSASTAVNKSSNPATPVSSAISQDQLNLSPLGLQLGYLQGVLGSIKTLFGLQPAQAPDLTGFVNAINSLQQQKQANVDQHNINNMLESSALQQSAAIVKQYFGLSGNGSTIKETFDMPADSGALASVSYDYNSKGQMINAHLNLNKSQFLPDTTSNGTNQHVIQNDRIIAHEITHAIMGVNMDFKDLPQWFKEGTAELIAGGAERTSLALQGYTPKQFVAIAGENWVGDSPQYASSYMAVRYLNDTTQSGGGIKQVMQDLKAGDSLDTAINKVSGGTYSSSQDLLQSYEENGPSYIKSLNLSLPGAIDGAKTGNAVVPDHGAKSTQPLTGFRMVWA